MRIALYHNLMSGGAKRSMTEAIRRLAARHEVHVYTSSAAEHDFADLRPWVAAHHVAPFAPLPLLQSPWGRANQVIRCIDLSRVHGLTRRIAAEIDNGGYDVLLVHPCRFEQAPSVLQHVRRTPSVYYCHEPLRLVYETMPARPYDDNAGSLRRMVNTIDPLPAVHRGMLRRGDRASTRAAGTVIVNSRFVADSVDRVYGVSAHVSYHGVDAGEFKPLAVEKRDIVLSVGSLTPLKGFDFLIQAMAKYAGKNRPRLVIASNFTNPPEREFLERMGRDLAVDLEFLDRVTDERLVQLYNKARAVVYAPVREPFGLVPLEAMACATPVVGVREGGIPESVVHGETGMLTDRDPALFAAAIQQLIDDPCLARRLGDNGRDLVLNRWTWDRAVDTLENHLVESARRRP